MTLAAEQPASGKQRMLQRFFLKPEFGPLVLLIVEIIVFTAINPQFISALNISNTLAFSVELGLVALGMTLLMTSGEFDLSVGSIFGLTPVVMWTLYNAGSLPMEAAFVIAMLVAGLIGWFNGIFVTRLKIPSFLVTLGMLLVARGTALFITVMTAVTLASTDGGAGALDAATSGVRAAFLAGAVLSLVAVPLALVLRVPAGAGGPGGPGGPAH